jgi:hypothetical protein
MSDQPIQGGGPAFPLFVPGAGEHGAEIVTGLELRDYFAVRALDIVHAASGIEGPLSPKERAGLASEAYALADAMLKERSKDSRR